MAALQVTTSDAALLDWPTRVALSIVVVPLLLWGGFSVAFFAKASGISPWLCWLPALGTSGVMLVSTLVSLRTELARFTHYYAAVLAVTSVSVEIVISGLRHAMDDHFDPGFWGAFAIAGLPSLMGGASVHMVALVIRQGRRERGEHAAQLRTADAAMRVITEQEAADTRRRSAELEHEHTLAELRERAAQAAAAQRKSQQKVANVDTPKRPTLVPDPPQGPTDALGRAARPSPKRDAALRYLIGKCRAGQLAGVTAAEVATHISSDGSYTRKHLTQWKQDVQAYVERGAA